MRLKRRWIWLGVVLVPVLLWVTQCTPVIGCLSEHTYAEGRHFGFTIGMDRRAAADVVRRDYDVADVSVWTGGSDITFIGTLDELKAVAEHFQQWRFDNRRRPLCQWSRNVVLVFEGERLKTIQDELSIAYP